MKKILSTLLAAILVLSACVTTAFAAETIQLSDKKSLTLEFENLAEYIPVSLSVGKDSNPDNKASGGDFLFSTWKSGPIQFSLPIHVPAENLYTLELICSYGGWLSPIQVYLDSTENDAILSTTSSPSESLGETVGYFNNSTDFPPRKFTASTTLPAGDHDLIFYIDVRTAANGGGCAFVLDCLTFIPAVIPEAEEVTVSASGKTVIEYEDYAEFVLSGDVPYSGATIADDEVTQAYASGGKVLNMSERTTLTDAVIHIPIYVEADGVYDLNHFIINANKGQYLSLCSLKLDGEQISVNNGTGISEDLSYPNADGKPTYMSQYYPMARYATRITLTEGSHLLALEATPITTLTNGAYGVKFFADCITIEPYEEPKTEISGDTMIELEDYADKVYTTDEAPYNGGIGTNEKASGGKYFQITYGSIEEAHIPIDVEVTNAGWYDIESVMHAKENHLYVGKVQISIDGTEVLNNSNKYIAEDLSDGNTFLNSDFRMHRFTNRVYLTEGAQTLLVYCDNNTPDKKVKFIIDYIRFLPAETRVSFTSDKVKVNAAYETDVQGIAVAAFYKDNQLTHLATKDISEATQIFDIDTETAVQPDTVKVFLWDSLAGAKPVADVSVLTDIEIRTPVLYLLGDSVCAHYDSYSFWQQGWGNHIMPLFENDINVLNYALGGRSTKTFRDNDNWTNILAGIKYGDYVMINFGLNDIGSIASGKGTTLEDYEMYLNLYCDEIQEKGATPILISPMPECNTSHNSLIARSNVMEKVAGEQGAIFLPLNNTLNYQWILDENGNYSESMAKATFDYYFLSEAAFHRLEEEYGKEIPQDQWDYIAETPDRTHINIDGAQHVAQTIADLLAESDSPLKNYLK